MELSVEINKDEIVSIVDNYRKKQEVECKKIEELEIRANNWFEQHKTDYDLDFLGYMDDGISRVEKRDEEKVKKELVGYYIKDEQVFLAAFELLIRRSKFRLWEPLKEEILEVRKILKQI